MHITPGLQRKLTRLRYHIVADRIELKLARRDPCSSARERELLALFIDARQTLLDWACGELDALTSISGAFSLREPASTSLENALKANFNPAQPRIPAGQPGAGQWTSGGGGSGNGGGTGSPFFGADGSATADDAATGSGDLSSAIFGFAPDGTPILAAGDGATPTIDPNRANYHDYTAGPTMVCSADERCSREEMADYLSRFAVPGQDPARPVRHGDVSDVFDPIFGSNVGSVNTAISNNGLKIVNSTEEGHIFYYGEVERRVIENPDGSMSVMTRGTGNNTNLGLSIVNQYTGPEIFDRLDRQMRDYIAADRRAKKSFDYFRPEPYQRGGSFDGFPVPASTGAAHAL